MQQKTHLHKVLNVTQLVLIQDQVQENCRAFYILFGNAIKNYYNCRKLL